MHGAPGPVKRRPDGHRIGRQAQDLARRRISPKDRPIRVVVNDTERQRLEQGPVLLLSCRQALGQHLQTAPVPDMRVTSFTQMSTPAAPLASSGTG